ncbi:MAG: DUF6585 family protein [Chloroflexota bacterium]
MSDDSKQVTRDPALSIYDPDPMLGKYISHHPSNRIRLMIIGGLIYALPVGLLQIIFFNQDTDLVAIFLPVTFAAIAGGVLWWVLHHWNREVVLYEKGFSYRQGSAIGYIRYANVVKMITNLEQIGFLGLSRKVFDYRLMTDIDETLIINNVYSNVDKLTRALEAYVARDRLPIILGQLADGQTVNFGENLQIHAEGLILNDKQLAWTDFSGQRVKDGQLMILSDDTTWDTIDVTEIDNPVLLITILRNRGLSSQQTS